MLWIAITNHEYAISLPDPISHPVRTIAGHEHAVIAMAVGFPKSARST
jgi:hypothetical protein